MLGGIANAQLIGPDVDSFRKEVIHWASNDMWMKDAMTYDSLFWIDSTMSLFVGNVPGAFFPYVNDSNKVYDLANDFTHQNLTREKVSVGQVTILKNTILSAENFGSLFPQGGLRNEWADFRQKRPKVAGLAYMSNVGFTLGYEYAMVEFGIQTGEYQGRSVIYLLKRDFREWKLVTSFCFIDQHP